MKHKQHQQESNTELKRRRSSNRHALLVVALLFTALIAGGSVAPGAGQSVGWRGYLWVGLSIFGMLVLMWSLLKSYQQSDERQQAIQLKAAALTFMVVMTGLAAAQLLHAINLVNITIALQVIFIGGCLFWNALLGIIDRRSL